MYALQGKPGVTVFMLSPAGRMTPFQQAQMFSLNDPSIVNIAVDGVFDDCQDIVKAINADAGFKQRHRVGAVNSINWARLLAQVVYYFAAYLQVVPEGAPSRVPSVPEERGNVSRDTPAFLVATDARRKELYWATYDADGNRIGEPQVSAPTELPGLPVVGTVPDEYRGLVDFRADLPLDPAALAAHWPSLPVAGDEPYYLRPADATVPGKPKSALPRLRARR